MTRPISFRIYDRLAQSGPAHPDPSLDEMARILGVRPGSVRSSLYRMRRRGIVVRVGCGVYRLAERDASA